MYETPEKYYFRLHHCRPRFKNNIEDVLIHVATEVSRIGERDKDIFADKLNDAIKRFPGNSTKKDKTINNWRTEISALLGLILHDNEVSKPSPMAKYLTDEQDLVSFFKYFLYYFQYPGGHTKPHETVEHIRAGVKFKPAKYILSLLKVAENNCSKRYGIHKGEVAHLIFNDLRVTRDNRPVEEVIDLMEGNRIAQIEYDMRGDVTRYSKDILDYMVLANLLVVRPNHHYYINRQEVESINAFIDSELYYSDYDDFYDSSNVELSIIKETQSRWFRYVNQDIGVDLFKTDILSYLETDEDDKELVGSSILNDLRTSIEHNQNIGTKQIGDTGENLTYGHECQRLINLGRSDLTHLVKVMPTALAVGYDIQSIEVDERKRYIEVKTTISNSPLILNSFHLTTNEWGTAQTLGDRYFVYRLMITKNEVKLYIIQDPVGKYKKDKINMMPRNGADISYNPAEAGNYEEFLIWEK